MKKSLLKHSLAFSSLALSVSLFAGAQTVPPPNNTQQDDRPAQSHDADHPDATRAELANFNRFLDSHPEIAEQLRRHPELVDDQRFVRDHPALQDYLENHHELATQLKADPNALMRDEHRYDRTDDRGAGINRPELMRFNQFLDSHPEVADPIRRDPSRVDDPNFVMNHPALQAYLQDHPEARNELRENPNAFMLAEARPEDQRGDDRGFDSNRSLVESFDRFLDSHPEVAEQLRKDPSLADNGDFVRNHPALATYLEDHPEVRAEIRSNPDGFMQAEARYDRSEYRPDDRRTEDFGRFLNEHRNIANDLSRNPALVNDRNYMDNCPDLKAYLSAHPDVQAQLTQNPEGFMRSTQPFTTAPAAPSQVNPGASAPLAKPKP
jgi:hypothetical protein